MGDQVPDLPLEVLSNVAALVPPPFYPSAHDPSSSRSHPLPHIVEALDPRPTSASHPTKILSTLSRTSHTLLEASRPWLWEEVDVRSGRGWLSVVNALTEEVHDDEEGVQEELIQVDHKGEAKHTGISGMPMTPVSPPTHIDGLPPIPAVDAHAHTRPDTTPGGTSNHQSYTPAGPHSHLPQNPTSTGSNDMPPAPLQRTFTYSPPQPPHVAMLLTPPGSRTASPSPQPESRLPLAPALKSPTSATASRLRGRSRSPRRSINFDTEGISSVLDRSRSLSAHPPRRIPLERRRSSLSRARTMLDIEDDDDDENENENEDENGDEDEDELMPLAVQRGASYRREISPPTAGVEESWENVNPELLPMPGPYIRHLSFTNFKTIGSRRSQEEAVRGRFVTAGRLEGVIKNTPNLITLCMTEYVDSALSSAVFEELLFRGSRRPRAPRRPSISNGAGGSLSRVRSMSVGPVSVASATTQQNQLDPPRPVYVPYETETEEQMWTRRSMFTPLEALDLTGCVSTAFTEATRDFYDSWLTNDDEEDGGTDDGRGRGRSRRRIGDTTDDESEVESSFVRSLNRPSTSRSRRRPKFVAMKRLSLRACTSLDSVILHDLLLCFPNLTHLDLSNTKISSSYLMALTDKPPSSLRLQSLSLARCTRLDTHVIVDFICRSPAAKDLVELNLYVNPTQGNAVDSEELATLLKAPCFKSGKLRYLDLSSAGFSPAHLTPEYFPAQPSLLSLGLSHIPFLPLAPITQFLLTLAPNVEILTLTGTSMESSLRSSASPLQTNLEVHGRLINPTTTIPFSLSALSLAATGGPNLNPGPTRLRVVELSSGVRKAINEGGGGHGEWRVIRSKGGRGWYVDTSAGWIQDRSESQEDWTFVRHLPKDHNWRKHLTSLSDASGRVGSGVGWHARKMEVIKGLGMLGREEGLAGAGAFAFEE